MSLHELNGMVCRAFTLPEFEKYLEEEVIHLPHWDWWTMVEDHNTGRNPHWTKDTTREESIQLVKNMSVAWASPPNNWRSGPHFVLGPNLMVVAAWPINKPGTHSPSWNHCAIGTEHSGDFDVDQFPDDYREFSLGVTKALYKVRKLRANNDSYKHHHEDPRTTHHHCPGVHYGPKPWWLSALNPVSQVISLIGGTPKERMYPSAWVEDKLKRLEAMGGKPDLKAYVIKGIWHIGYGFRDGFRGLHIDATTTMTQEQADTYFNESLTELSVTIQNLIHAPLNQNEFDALILLTWNIGPGALTTSTIVRCLNAPSPDYQAAADAFLRFNKWREHPGAPLEVSEPLDARRHYERSIFLKPIDAAPAKPAAIITASKPLIGEIPMAIVNTQTINTASIIGAASALGAVLPKIIQEGNTVGWVAAGVLGVCCLIQFFLPTGTAKSLESAVVSVIPVAEAILPAEKAALEQVKAGVVAAEAVAQ